MNRVVKLADQTKEQAKPLIPSKHLIPLEEIISELFGVGVGSKKVQTEYEKLIQALGSEFKILLKV